MSIKEKSHRCQSAHILKAALEKGVNDFDINQFAIDYLLFMICIDLNFI